MLETLCKICIGNEISKEFEVTSGVKQGDTLSATYFRLALNAAVKELNLRSKIFHKSKQCLAYADDILLIARNTETLKNMFINLEENRKIIGLKINEVYERNETKYLRMLVVEYKRKVQGLRINGYNFEGVTDFTYLVVNINSTNNISTEINQRIKKGSIAYYTNITQIKSSLITRRTKVKVNKTLIRPIYGPGYGPLLLKIWRFYRDLKEKLKGEYMDLLKKMKDGE